MKNENMIREKLYHHTVPVRDGLWDAIEAQLPPEKKRKAFPLFWFTLFGTTLLGAAVMIGIKKIKKCFTSQKKTNGSLEDYLPIKKERCFRE